MLVNLLSWDFKTAHSQFLVLHIVDKVDCCLSDCLNLRSVQDTTSRLVEVVQDLDNIIVESLVDHSHVGNLLRTQQGQHLMEEEIYFAGSEVSTHIICKPLLSLVHMWH